MSTLRFSVVQLSLLCILFLTCITLTCANCCRIHRGHAYEPTMEFRKVEDSINGITIDRQDIFKTIHEPARDFERIGNFQPHLVMWAETAPGDVLAFFIDIFA